MISRGIKRTITVIMVLVSVLLLVSPVVFGKVLVKIDDEGLKSLHIRAFILKEDGPGGHGPKHGRVQAMIREVTPRNYSYKFMLDLRKASANTPYGIWLWANLPEELEITIYGNKTLGKWEFIEEFAVLLGIDGDGQINEKIEILLGALLSKLGFTEEIIEEPTGLSFTTDDSGSFKSIKEGIINESNAMEYALDLAWPPLRQHLISKIPLLEQYLPPKIDFADLGIIGVTIYGDKYSVSGGVIFKGGDPEQPGWPVDVYKTEDIFIDRTWNDFVWWAPGWEPESP